MAAYSLGTHPDGVLFIDVDGDQYGDIIAQHFPGVYWLEAENNEGTKLSSIEIGELPPTGHVNGQGYATAQPIPGGKPEVLLATEEGLYYFRDT